MNKRLIAVWSVCITVDSLILKGFAFHHTPQVSCSPLIELNTNHWMLTVTRKPWHTCIIIHKHPSTNRISEGFLLHYGVKVQQLVMLWTDSNALNFTSTVLVFFQMIIPFPQLITRWTIQNMRPVVLQLLCEQQRNHQRLFFSPPQNFSLLPLVQEHCPWNPRAIKYHHCMKPYQLHINFPESEGKVKTPPCNFWE